MTATAPPERRWLFGPLPDLFLGCGLGYGLLLLLLLIPAVQGSVAAWVPFAAALLGIVTNSPHYGATLLRVYKNREDRRKYLFFTLHATIAIFALFVAGLHVVWLGSLLITAYITWSPWHFAGQNYGLALMFLRRRDIPVTPSVKRLLYGSFLLSFVLTFLTIHGRVRVLGVAPAPTFSREVFEFLSLGLPMVVVDWGLGVAAVANVAVILAAAVLLLRRASPADLAPTALLIALQSLWFSVPSLLYALEALDTANLALSTLWIAIAHSVQYLWITSYYATKEDDPTTVRTFLLKCLLAGAAVTIVPALVFAPRVLGGLSYQAGLAILLFSVVNLHHFVLDGAIWKLRDGRVGRILLQNASAQEAPRVGPPAIRRRFGLRGVVFAAGAVSLLVAVVGKWEMEFGVQRALAASDLPRVAKAAERLAWIGRESHAVHQHLGLQLGKLPGRYDEARRHFERSLEIHPSVAAWTELGALDMRAGNHARAVESFEAALALDPGDLRSLLRLGEAWVALGRPDRAIEPLERAAELAPGSHGVQSQLSRARRAARDAVPTNGGSGARSAP